MARQRFAPIAILSLATLLGTGILVYRLLQFDICDTDLSQRISSPDKLWDVVVFHRDCGATVDYNTQVSILTARQKFSFDVFPSFLSVDGRHDLSIRWLGNRKLEIVLPSNERTHRKNRSANGITIVYR